jgi:hypothetical protein
LLNLADCYERLGQTATAWSTFKDAEAEAHKLTRTDRERTARDRSRALEQKLSKVVFLLPDKGLEVHRDGVLLDDATLGGPVPMDPGPHKIEVTAKGKKPFTTNIEVAQGPVQQKLEVPKLEAAGPEAAPASAPPGQGAATTPPPPSGSEGGGGALRTVGLITAGVGVVGLGVGTYFGIRTLSLKSDVNARCAPQVCYDADSVALNDEAKQSGNISTIAFVAGGVFTVGGVVMYLFAPKSNASSSGEAAKTKMYPVVGGDQIGARMEGKF